MARIDGRSLHPLYGRWKGMRTRCNHDKSYKKITVCKRWDNFWLWLKDMGPPPTIKHHIDRIKPTGNYTPKNCRWLLPKNNSFNKGNYSNNTSGIKGVMKSGKYWVARISCNSNKYTISAFISKHDAAIVRKELEKLWPNEKLIIKKIHEIKKNIINRRLYEK